MLSNVSEHDIMQRAYQCRVQSACFCCPKDNILSPLAHFTARQTQTAGGRERLGPKSATKNCLKPDITGKKGGIKSWTSAQRHFNDRSCLWLNLLSSPQRFLIRQNPQLLGWVGASQGGNYREELGMPGARCSQVGRGEFSGSQVCQAMLASNLNCTISTSPS